jgi:hypothetical protein
MQITELTIKQASRYDENAGQYVGLLYLAGPTGTQSLPLSPRTINGIFQLLRDDAAATARLNAKAVPGAVDNAASVVLLATTSTLLEDTSL